MKLKGIKGVIFDLDGTLAKSLLSFSLIRKEIGIPLENSVLEYIEQLAPEKQVRAWEILNTHEIEAAYKAELYPGTKEILAYLENNHIKKAIVTRNSRKSVEIVLQRHLLNFDAIITREDTDPKPSAKPMLLAAQMLGVEKDFLLNVGDYKWDLLAGKNAEIFSVLILHEKHAEDFVALSDGWVHSLFDLIAFIKSHNSKNLLNDN